MVSTTQITGPEAVPRADRTRNRRRLVEAARAAIAEDGEDVPLAEVARRAGLSPATLYRHFPHRAELHAAVFEREIERCQDLLDRADEEADARAALLGALRRFAEVEAAQPGFTLVLVDDTDGPTRADAFRHRGLRQLQVLVDRARTQGTVRDDLTLEDISFVLTAIRAVARRGGGRSRERALRAVELFDTGCSTR